MNDLNSVLAGNAEELNFFNSLPEHVQNVLNAQGDTIHSVDDLHWYADGLINTD